MVLHVSMSILLEQLLKKVRCDDVNVPESRALFCMAHTVEIPRGAFTYHPLMQSQRSLSAVNQGPGRLTVLPWPLLYAASFHDNNMNIGGSIYIIQLLGNFWLIAKIECKVTVKVTVLSSHSMWIENSLLRNAPRDEEIGSTNERHHSTIKL